jgi:hypothetical protein
MGARDLADTRSTAIRGWAVRNGMRPQPRLARQDRKLERVRGPAWDYI